MKPTRSYDHAHGYNRVSDFRITKYLLKPYSHQLINLTIFVYSKFSI
jgi:hypothetical protein